MRRLKKYRVPAILKSIERYLKKAEEDQEADLKERRYVNPGKTIEDMETLEEKLIEEQDALAGRVADDLREAEDLEKYLENGMEVGNGIAKMTRKIHTEAHKNQPRSNHVAMNGKSVKKEEKEKELKTETGGMLEHRDGH